MSINQIQTMVEAIAQHTKSQLPKGDGMTFGTIKSLDPLSIRVDNYNFDLPEEFFFLGRLFHRRDHKKFHSPSFQWR